MLARGVTFLPWTLALAVAMLATAGVTRPHAPAAAPLDHAPSGARPTEPSAKEETFGEWFASGSGEDVRRELVDAGAEGSRARFYLPSFHLRATRAAGTAPAVAAECALRFTVGAPPGARIARVSATVSLAVEKRSAGEVSLRHALKLGAAAVASFEEVFPAGVAAPREPLAVHLAAGAPGQAPLPPLPCGKRKILGFDTTWLGKAGPEGDEPSARFAGDRAVDVEVTFEPCPPGS